MKVYSMKTIEDLLKKFMDGKTTLEEEQLLAQYFRRDDVPDALSDYKEMFRWLECGTTDGTTKEKNMCRKSGKRWWVAAASVLFIVTATFTILQTTPRKTTEVAVASINTDKEKDTKSEVTITSETANGNENTLETTNPRTKTPPPHLKRQASGSTTEYIGREKHKNNNGGKHEVGRGTTKNGGRDGRSEKATRGITDGSKWLHCSIYGRRKY